jgi:hypothetical protein
MAAYHVKRIHESSEQEAMDLFDYKRVKMKVRERYTAPGVYIEGMSAATR